MIIRSMAARSLENASLRSSVTESDLEEARQKLLEHMDEEQREDTSEWGKLDSNCDF